jgi:hypothetical protein
LTTQSRKTKCSTKTTPITIVPDSDDPCLDKADDFHPPGIEAKTHQCFATFLEPTGQIYTKTKLADLYRHQAMATTI